MRVLIIGASGLVGGALLKEFKATGHQVHGTYHHHQTDDLFQLDVNDKPGVEDLISRLKPDAILHPAAYANVDGCEKNPRFCRQVNVEGAKNVINAVCNRNIPYVFFSTDYIFDGLNGPYNENDHPNPLSVYGHIKLETEKYLKVKTDNYLIVRTCGVFGWEAQGKNFVVRLIDNLKNKQEVNIVTDQYATPTYAPNLAQAVAALVENKKQGVYNISGTTYINRFNFAKQVAKVFKLDEKLIKPATTSQINQAAKRPLKGGLKVEKAQKVLSFELLSSEKALEIMKKANKN